MLSPLNTGCGVYSTWEHISESETTSR